MPTDRMTKLILAFRNFANTPKNSSEENRRIWAQKTGSERNRWKVNDEELTKFLLLTRYNLLLLNHEL